MRIQRIETKQGHPVPKSAHNPKGPFPPELFQRPEVIVDYIPVDQDVPVSGTAQNDFQEQKIYKCNYCEELVYENKLQDHTCEERNG